MTKLPKVLTEGEFDRLLTEGDRLEVIALALADNRIDRLPNNYYKHYERMKAAFTLLLDEPVERRAMQRIAELEGLQYHQVQKLVADVKELFPQLESASREFDRLVQITRIERLIEKIEFGVEKLVTVGEDGEELDEPKTMLIGGDVHSKSLPPLYKLLNELKGTKPTEENRIPYDDLHLPVPTFSTDITDMPGFTQADEVEWSEVPAAAESETRNPKSAIE